MEEMLSSVEYFNMKNKIRYMLHALEKDTLTAHRVVTL